ncbi:sodium:solute symporter family protein [Cereibacter changlensis]|nr:sodium:solute symporter family protein [Cereibacter changlensis]
MRRKKDFKFYALGDGTLGPLLIAASLAATYIGPGLSIGLSGQSFSVGWWFPLAACAYLFQFFLIAYLIGPKIKERYGDVSTLGDVLCGSACHPGKAYLLTTATFTFLIMVGVAGIMTLISGTLISTIFGIDRNLGGVLATILVATYTTFGGLKASVYANLWQLLITSLVVVVVFILGETSSGEISNETADGTNAASPLVVLGVVVSFILGDFLQPPFFQRLAATKTARALKKAYTWCGMYMFSWFILMGAIGVSARDKIPHDTDSDAVLFAYAEYAVGPGFSFLILITLYLIVMSGHDAIINASASTATNDIIGRIAPSLPKRSIMILMTVVVAFLGIVLAQYFDSVMHGILFLSSLWAPAVAVPLILGIYRNEETHLPAMMALIFGSTASLITTFTADEMPAIAVGVLVSAGVFLLTSLICSRQHKENLQ